MKVLYVIDTIQGSGAERSLVEIALHLKKYTPVFVHIYKGDMLKPMLQKAGIKVYSLNIPGPRNFSKAAKELEKVYIKEKPDIVHATLYNSEAIARKLKNKFSFPLVGSYVSNSYSNLRLRNHGFIMRLKLKLVQLYDAYTSRKVDFFISNSETIKKEKARSTLVNPAKVKVVYRGRDIRKFEEKFSIEELLELRNSLKITNQFVLLSVGRLIESKGQMDIVNAMPGILNKYPQALLLLAGHGVFSDKLKIRAKELGIENKVLLLGRRLDVPQLLSIADLFIFPSYSEGLPGALIEAMMAEKPIICSDIPENKECVTEETAIFFMRGNVKDLENKILFGINNIEQLQQKGAEAKKLAGKKFDISKIAGEYEKTYDQFIGL